MTTKSLRARLAAVCAVPVLSFPLLLSAPTASASDFETIGAAWLRQVDPTLNGTGVPVAQAEAGAPSWEVNPAAVSQPASLFSYSCSNGTVNVFPNSFGSESSHADAVASFFYGAFSGVSPGVAQVMNYEANYFINQVIASRQSVPVRIVNQSFAYTALPVTLQQSVDSAYDDVAAQQNVLFVSGAGNSGTISVPGTAYNSIAVGAYGGASAVGPTVDNGRSKPDLTAPGVLTSFSTPLVAGAAAVLLQAATREAGGAGTATMASDIRTLKALLLNGAVKPADWTHSASAPLDTRYGAGILNLLNSWHQLTAGRVAWIESGQVTHDGEHPPGSAAGNVPSLTGWDLNSLASTVNKDGVNHYYFSASAAGGAPLTFTATLTWNRQANQNSIDDLDLFLVNTLDHSLLGASTSRVDNVEHLFVLRLAPGRYDLQVLKRGGSRVSLTETYALAFEGFAVPLAITGSEGKVRVSWPIAPAGFALEATPDLANPASWAAVTAPLTITNQQFQTEISAPGALQFYRLRRP